MVDDVPVNRWRVTTPVLGMIDEVAEQLNYWPVPAEAGAERRRPRKLPHRTSRRRGVPRRRRDLPNPTHRPTRSPGCWLTRVLRPWHNTATESSPRRHPLSVTRVYTRAFGFFREDAAKIVLSAVLIVLSTLAAMLQPFPLMILVDSVVGRQEKLHWAYRAFFAVAPADKPRQIATLAGAALFLRLAQEALQVWQGALKVRISYNGLLRVRCACSGSSSS